MKKIICKDCNEEYDVNDNQCDKCGCLTSDTKEYYKIKYSESFEYVFDMCPVICECNKNYSDKNIYIRDDAIYTYCPVCQNDRVIAPLDLERAKRFNDVRRKGFYMAEQESQNKYVPHCPTCGSTNIKKLSTTKRITHGAMFGLFSKTARSQWECKNCGNKW